MSDSYKYNKEINILMDVDKVISASFCTECGDVNGNLNIFPSDAQVAFEIFLLKISNPTDCEKENADVNCDGTYNPLDAVLYVNYVYKNMTQLFCQSPCDE